MTLAQTLSEYATDEGINALRSKLDRWIPVLEELAELKVQGALSALTEVKEAFEQSKTQWLADGVKDEDWLR